MSASPKFNRVFLSVPGFFRYEEAKGEYRIIRDGSAFPYQVEELITLGAIKVAVAASDMADDYIKSLPTSLKKRVVQVDKRGICRQRVDSLFAPIAEEVGIKTHYGGFYSDHKLDENLRHGVPT